MCLPARLLLLPGQTLLSRLRVRGGTGAIDNRNGDRGSIIRDARSLQGLAKCVVVAREMFRHLLVFSHELDMHAFGSKAHTGGNRSEFDWLQLDHQGLCSSTSPLGKNEGAGDMGAGGLHWRPVLLGAVAPSFASACTDREDVEVAASATGDEGFSTATLVTALFFGASADGTFCSTTGFDSGSGLIFA